MNLLKNKWVLGLVSLSLIGSVAYYWPKITFLVDQLKVEQAPVSVPVKETPDDTKKIIEGKHLEWKIPDGVNQIVLKYKESNGRLIYSYKFKVDPGQRVEIRGTE